MNNENNQLSLELDVNPLPPRREVHKRKKKQDKTLKSSVERNATEHKEKSNLEFSNGIVEDNEAIVEDEEVAATAEGDRSKGSLIFANLLLWLFLLSLGTLLFYVITS